MSGFKNRFAHSKLGSLNLGNKDIKQLADVISTEKNIAVSTGRLSNDTRKAAEALREYGNSEGDDLADILPKVGFLFEQLAKAEAKYSEHVSTYRLFFKTLRTREEGLMAMRKSKEQLQGRIESAEKQLGKTSAEHKERTARESKLYELKQQMIGSEQGVINEEARLGDFKRETVREAMGLKLGAMIELSERTSIIGEMCRLLVAEVPNERTTPGHARPMYTSHSTTEEVMQEAQNCLSSVVFNPVSNRDLHNNPDNSFEPPPDTPYSGYEQDPLRNSTSSNNNRLSNSTNTSQAPQLPPFRRQTPDFRDERPLDLPESPARHPSTLGPPLLPPVLHGNHSFGSMDQRSSLAYMEAPNQDPVPIQFARSNEDITPNGPPREYSASGGLPRHGVRGDTSTAYEYEDSAHWVRNNAGRSGPTAAEPIEMPRLPIMPQHIQQATIPTAEPETSTVQQREEEEEAQRQQEETQRQQEDARRQEEDSRRQTEAPAVHVQQPTEIDEPSRQYQTPVEEERPIQKEEERPVQRERQTYQLYDPPAQTASPPPGRANSYDSQLAEPSRTYTTSTPYYSPVAQSIQEEPEALSELPSRSPAEVTPTIQQQPPTFPVAPKRQSYTSNRPTSIQLQDRPSSRGPDPKSPRPLPEAPLKSPSLPSAARPNVPRGASALGSKHGFDDPSYQAAKDTNNLSQTSRFPVAGASTTAQTSTSAGLNNGPSGYSYHRAEPPAQPNNGRITASAFRKNTGNPSGPSESAKIREAWLSQSAAEREREEQELMRQRAAEAAEQRQADTPVSVAPLKLNKTRSGGDLADVSEQDQLAAISPTSALPPPSYERTASPAPGSYSSNRYVTRLE